MSRTPLFPDNGVVTIEQGSAGDCYLLASLDCILNQPEGYTKIKSMFKASQNPLTGKERVEVRIKHNKHSQHLKKENIGDKYTYFHDDNSNEDVFYIDEKKLNEIDSDLLGVQSNSLAVKILERIIPYYFVGHWGNTAPNASVGAHNINQRFADTSTKFVGDILDVCAEESDQGIDTIIQHKLANPLLPFYISMQYGQPDNNGLIHDRHALRVDKIIQDNNASDGYWFILRNPWDNRKTERYSLGDINKRKFRVCSFTIAAEHKLALQDKKVESHTIELDKIKGLDDAQLAAQFKQLITKAIYLKNDTEYVGLETAKSQVISGLIKYLEKGQLAFITNYAKLQTFCASMASDKLIQLIKTECEPQLQAQRMVDEVIKEIEVIQVSFDTALDDSDLKDQVALLDNKLRAIKKKIQRVLQVLNLQHQQHEGLNDAISKKLIDIDKLQKARSNTLRQQAYIKVIEHFVKSISFETAHSETAVQERAHDLISKIPVPEADIANNTLNELVSETKNKIAGMAFAQKQALIAANRVIDELIKKINAIKFPANISVDKIDTKKEELIICINQLANNTDETVKKALITLGCKEPSDLIENARAGVIHNIISAATLAKLENERRQFNLALNEINNFKVSFPALNEDINIYQYVKERTNALWQIVIQYDNYLNQDHKDLIKGILTSKCNEINNQAAKLQCERDISSAVQNIITLSISFDNMDSHEEVARLQTHLLTTLTYKFKTLTATSQVERAFNMLELTLENSPISEAYKEKQNEIKTAATRANNKIDQVQTVLKTVHFEHHLTIIRKKLEILEHKAKINPNNQDYQWAVYEATQLVDALSAAQAQLYNNQGTVGAFKETCLDAINQALPVLEKHRGWGKVLTDLGNILLKIVPSGSLREKMGFFHLPETDSAKKVKALKQEIENLSENLSLDAKPDHFHNKV